MQKSKIILTNHQLDFASSTEYPLLKHEVMAQIVGLLHETAHHLQAKLPALADVGHKVTRGENHQLMPYLVLDLPRIQHPSFDLLTRTLFWWGHYFSFNLIIRKSLIHKHS